MIEGLASRYMSWLAEFFAAPNELLWEELFNGSAPPELADQVRPWLDLLADPDSSAPIVLPLVRAGSIVGWYATTRSAAGGHELGAELQGWLGPTYLSVFEMVESSPSNSLEVALSSGSGGILWKFTGADAVAREAIASRLRDYISLLRQRPQQKHQTARPVGAIRGDFERALLAKHAAAAENYIVELRNTGRLNEENLRYLDVRLSAGLGLWRQIARDHWLIQTMSDLALPPQILADIIEALYRTHIDSIEAEGDVGATLSAFETHIADRYPRLFSSRRGIRTRRVVKAFLLFEQLQPRPNSQLIEELVQLLGDDDKHQVLSKNLPIQSTEEVDPEGEADEAFDDLQYDRAFSFYETLPLSKKIIGRLLTCAQFIGTNDARTRLHAALTAASPELLDRLVPAMREKLAALNKPDPGAASTASGTEVEPADEEVSNSLGPIAPDGWIAWAHMLRQGDHLSQAELAAQSALTNWHTSEFKASVEQSGIFADMIGNLNGEAALLARRTVPQIFASFFPDEEAPTGGTKPIAAALFALIAMDDGLSASDLDLLAQLLTIQITLGLTSDEYVSLVTDLEDVQERVRSYANLPWSLDVCETLAVSPAQYEVDREARLAFFVNILSQAQAFAHRLGPQDLVPMEMLAKDFGVDPASIDALKRSTDPIDNETETAVLTDKLIGIYTLTEAAGARAKASLETMFPGCTVEVNSDLVATEKLRNLARTADFFVFAWKSSSHAAFYCIKDELPSGEPIWATGKGTASIVRAIVEYIG